MPNMNTHDKVKNIIGSEQSRLNCSCGSWIKHWRNYTKSSRTRCSVIGCNQEAKVGAHVISVDSRKNNNRYIIPTCYSCNHHSNKEEMFIEKGIRMIRANKNATCKVDYY